jgi:hypothetical protein
MGKSPKVPLTDAIVNQDQHRNHQRHIETTALSYAIAGILSFSSACQTCHAQDSDEIVLMNRLSHSGQDDEVIRTYSLDSTARGQPEAEYLAAYSLMATSRFEEAKPLLEACRQLGFDGYPGWTPVSKFLDRIASLERFRLIGMGLLSQLEPT